MPDYLWTRRQAISTLASTATLPLMSACNRQPAAPHPGGGFYKGIATVVEQAHFRG